MPNFTLDSFKDRVERISHGSQATLKELITDALLEGSNCCPLEKFNFLFGDQVTTLDETLYVYKWIWKVEGVQIFLPDITRCYPLAYIQKLLVPHTMGWNVTREQDGLAIGNLVL